MALPAGAALLRGAPQRPLLLLLAVALAALLQGATAQMLFDNLGTGQPVSATQLFAGGSANSMVAYIVPSDYSTFTINTVKIPGRSSGYGSSAMTVSLYTANSVSLQPTTTLVATSATAPNPFCISSCTTGAWYTVTLATPLVIPSSCLTTTSTYYAVVLTLTTTRILRLNTNALCSGAFPLTCAGSRVKLHQSWTSTSGIGGPWTTNPFNGGGTTTSIAISGVASSAGSCTVTVSTSGSARRSTSPSAAASPSARSASSSLSASPSASITPSPCPAPPGSYCTGGAILPCPIGAFCAGAGARNTSCFPVTACAVPGLAAQPPCLWSSATLAGNHATPGSADATGTAATFSELMGVASDAAANALVTDRTVCRLRRVTPAGVVTTLAGGGASSTQCGNVNALGTAALFDGPWGVSVRPNGALLVAEQFKSRLRAVTPAGAVTIIAGGGATGILAGSDDGTGTAALFNTPNAVAASRLDAALAWVADTDNFRVRRVPTGLPTSTLDPSGSGYTSGISAAPDDTLYVSDYNGRIVKLWPNNTHSVLASGLSSPRGNAYWGPDSVIVAEAGRHRIVHVTPQGVTVLAGGGAFGNLTGSANGYGSAALFPVVWGVAVTPAGAIYVAAGTALRVLTCAPCPAAFFCASGGGAPAPCPAGSACPLGTVTPAPCAAGSFSGPGAANCTQCAPGSHAPAPGASACAPCPGGHYCPLGTGATARLACGRGNFCPPASAAPRPCPLLVPPAGGWGAQGSQGPAFLTDTAGCANHCFWNSSTGSAEGGLLSRC